MFRLRKKIGSHKHRVGRFVSQNLYLRRPRRHINGDIPQADKLLGSGDILIAGTKDLINFRNTLCPVSHSGNGLYSTNLKDFADSSQTSGKQDSRMYLSILIRRCTKYNLFTSGNLSRYSQHKHSGE